MRLVTVLACIAAVLSCAWAEDVVCKKRTKTSVQVGDGESFSFKTQGGREYKPKSRCIVKYKKSSSCPSMRFSCSKFSLKARNPSCTKGDKMLVVMDGKAKRFCQGNPPNMTSSGDMKIVFISNRASQSSGAECSVECVSGQDGTPGNTGGPCGPEECGLTCKAGYTCVEVPPRCVEPVPCLIGDEICLLGCGNWICDNAGQEGETCGLSPVDGTCEKNLTCDYDDPFHYPCPTGKCIKPRKKEGESCGSIGSAPCEEWLSCVHDSNVTDAPGICKNKQEGESCGVSWGHSYGTCDEGLTCVYNPWIVDLPGTCKIPEKKEGESCGYTGSGECEQGLSCVHDSNITDASGTCGKKQEGESCGSCYCPPKNNEGECDNGLTCVPNRPDVEDKGTCVKN